MLIVMHPEAAEGDVAKVEEAVRAMGLLPHRIPGEYRTAVAVIGNVEPVPKERFEGLAGVAEVIIVSRPYKRASRETKRADTVIEVKGRFIGGSRFVLIGGPCAVESADQIMKTAEGVRSAGGHLLRGGAVKPRTSPYTFQGLGEEGYRLMHEAAEACGLVSISEVVDAETTAMARDHIDILQVGSRNMQNYSLLKIVGAQDKPVLLKRGASATLEEFLLSAEHIMAAGNAQVILCERGIRTFSDFQRNTFDVSVIPEIKARSHLPIIADPSHAVGKRSMIKAMSRASIAAGADGIMVEMHFDPEQALSDGCQSLRPAELADLFAEMTRLAPQFDKKVDPV
jgi:3-deoxy-7-phosphoheptulonate synthase